MSGLKKIDTSLLPSVNESALSIQKKLNHELEKRLELLNTKLIQCSESTTNNIQKLQTYDNQQNALLREIEKLEKMVTQINNDLKSISQ